MKIVVIAIVILVLLAGGVALLRGKQEVSQAPAQTQYLNDTGSLLPTTVPAQGNSMRKTYTSPPPLTISPTKTYTATLTTTKGTMKIQLFVQEDPQTVNNFVFLSKEGFYDNTPFHRIINGFMVQGGDPTGTGTGDPGYKFPDEKITRSYTRGTIAMANSGPNTNGSQFFIMHRDYDLPKNYVIFGTINPTDKESLATLDAIASVPVTDNGMGESSKPTEQIFVKSIQIEEK